MNYQLTSFGVLRIDDTANLSIVISSDDYAAYRNWVEAGNTPLPLPAADFIAQKATLFAVFNADRTNYLDALTGIAGRAWRASDTITSAACDRVAEGLLVLKQQPEVLAATNLLSLQRAMLLCYSRLMVDVPANVKAIFNKVQS